MDETVMRLAKPKKKGILGVVFSRFLIVVLLMAAQVAVVIWLFRRALPYFPHYAIVRTVFIAAMILYLFNSDSDNSTKLTWMWLIALVPLAGAGLLLYTKLNFGNRSIHRRTAELIDATRDALPQDEAALRALEGDAYGSDDLCRYLARSGCFPVYADTEARYFAEGKDCFDVMLEELQKAREFIYLEFFILEEGYMWGRVLDILARKAAAGVDVRVMYDGMCEISHLPYDYEKRLEGLGIRARSFSPVTPFISTHYNYRDHRKIMVIDGRVAFTGGLNLADEYINLVERFGHWKDAAVMLRGGAARSFLLMFLQMWNITEKEPDLTLPACPEAEPPAEAAGYVLPYGDIPLDAYRVGESVYIDMLYRAKSYVWFMTPYLILDGELETALKYAAERGVDVRLILPGIPDKKIPYALAKSHYPSLLASGVKIYEYTPGFMHSKVCVSDGCRAVVGSINLDYRSLYHHFECAAYLYKTPCIPDIEADVTHTLDACREVTPETVKHEKLLYRLAGGVMKLIAPLL